MRQQQKISGAIESGSARCLCDSRRWIEWLGWVPLTYIAKVAEINSQKKEKRKTTLMLSPVWITVTLLHIQVCPNLNGHYENWRAPHRLLLSFAGEHLGWARTNRTALVSPKGKSLHYSNPMDFMSYLFVNFVTFSIFMEKKCHICDIVVRNKLTFTQSNTLVLGFLLVSWKHPGELYMAWCTGNPVLGRSPIQDQLT
jgi:hypothetical protein